MLRKSVLASVLLILVLMLSISSVGAQGDGIVLNVFGPTSLDVLANFAPAEEQAAVQQAVIDGFLAENPEVSDVVWNAQGPIEEGVTRTLTAHLGGEPIDIIACAANPTNGTFIRRGIVRDISAEIEPFRDRFDEAALAAYSIGDAVYGIPVSTMSTSSFFYNATLFEELGLEIPTSYEEFITLSADLREAGVLPVLHQGATPWMWPMWYFETFAQTAGDPIAKTESNLRGETSFTDEADVAALAAIAQFVTDGILDETSMSVDWDGMRSAFANGQSAIYYGGTWELPWLDENITEFEYGVFEFPQLPGVPGGPGHGGGPDNGFCIYSGIAEEKLPYAVAFLEYVSRPDVAEQHLGLVAPLASSIEGVSVIDTPVADYLRANNFPHTVRFLDWIWPTEINDAIQGAIQGVVGGTMTAEEGMAQVQEAYDNLVADGYSYDS